MMGFGAAGRPYGNAAKVSAFLGAALALALGVPSVASAQSPQTLQQKIDQMEQEIQAKKTQMEQELQAMKAQMGQELQAMKAQMRQELQAMKAQMSTKQHRQEMAAKKTAAPSAGMAHSGNNKVTLKIYGQVDREILYASDGDNSDVLFTDNDVSGSRFGFAGTAKVSPAFEVGSKIVLETKVHSSGDASNDPAVLGANKPFGVSGSTVGIRKVEFYLADKNLGKLTLGHSSQATDHAAQVDLSGTELAIFSDHAAFGGKIAFRTNDDALVAAAKVRNIFANLDGDRKDEVRYDTPNLAGFVGSLSLEDNHLFGAGLKWGGRFPGFKAAAALGYERTPNSATGGSKPVDTVVGSGSVLLDSGLNATIAAGTQTSGATGVNEFGYWYGKLGYMFGAFTFGKTAIGVDYMHSHDAVVNGDDGDAFGIGLVQKVDAAALELYAGVHVMSYSQPGVNFQDVTVATTGGRVKF